MVMAGGWLDKKGLRNAQRRALAWPPRTPAIRCSCISVSGPPGSSSPRPSPPLHGREGDGCPVSSTIRVLAERMRRSPHIAAPHAAPFFDVDSHRSRYVGAVTDVDYMRLALRLARRGYGMTSPNPMVGAVLVKAGKIIGHGWHRRAGQPHAEIEAIRAAQKRGHNPKGATLYVTLEPCCTHGRTPPCTDAIRQAGIRRVVIGTTDPNPRHRGKGLAILRRAGISVARLSSPPSSSSSIPFGLRRSPPLSRRFSRTRTISGNEKSPPDLAVEQGQIGGWEFAMLSFPMPTLGAELAAGFPTLFSTASGVFGLVAGPFSVLRH